jgi:YD repeat-containing protein
MKAAKGKTARLACGLAIIVGLVLPNVATEAATTQYQYDALGRLRQVVHDNGIVTSYTLDPAGNRTQVADTPPAPPSAPASISVGTSSVTGSVTVTWGAASGVVTAYELYESSSNSFPFANTRLFGYLHRHQLHTAEWHVLVSRASVPFGELQRVHDRRQCHGGLGPATHAPGSHRFELLTDFELRLAGAVECRHGRVLLPVPRHRGQ